MGTLTRKEMEDVIRAGGSVVYKELVLSSIAQLPSEADLASGNPEQEAAARAALDAQIAALTQARARLDLASQPLIPPTPIAPPAPEDEDEPAPPAPEDEDEPAPAPTHAARKR